MLAPRLLTPQCFRLTWPLSTSRQSRWLHNATGRSNRKDRVRRLKPQKVSLFEELFPEEIQKGKDSNTEENGHTVPRLPLPEIDNFFEEFQDDLYRSRAHSVNVTSQAAAEAFRQQKIAVLILHIASKSLVESDFRRVAPKGRHIAQWTGGPGEFLKVIPARDPQTLEPAGYFFILFPNTAYARAYQSHVLHLHRVAKTYTPTSIKSPLPFERGVVIDGEDSYAVLQNYALCPPSQNLQLKLLYPQYNPSKKRLFDQRGYRQLVEGNDKTGRSVFFKVDGQQLTTSIITTTLAADGRERGLAWDMSIEKVDTLAAAAAEEEMHGSEYDGSPELRPQRSIPLRWILSFADENQARSFIRAWHRRPFPMARGDGPRLVHTEFMW